MNNNIGIKTSNIHISFGFAPNCLVIRNDTPILDCFQIQRESVTPQLISKIEAVTSGKFVYFLLDINQAKNTKRDIYIGETESLLNRINSHKKNKSWWNTMIVFGNKYLQLDDIKAIEKLLIEEYVNSNLYVIQNNVGSNATLSEHHDSYRQYILSIMDFLYYGITKTVVATDDGSKKPVKVKNVPQNNGRKPSFKFSMVGIKVGETLTFIKNKTITVKVLNDNEVEYQGKNYSLSKLAHDLLKSNVPLQGTKYFSYNGKILDDLRNEKEGKIIPNKTDNWIISCNTAYYDIDNAFKDLGTIEFHQTTNVEVHNKVYIYLSNNDKRLAYLTEAIVVNKPESTIDDSKYVKNSDGYSDPGRYMELKLIKKLDSNNLSLNDLKAHGLTSSLQGPCRVTVELQKYIDENE